MSQTEIITPAPFKNKNVIAIAMIGISAALAIAIGLASAVNPVVVLAGVFLLSLPVLLALLRWPNFIVVFVIFIIYTNTAVILVRFHDVPPVVGYAFPALLLIPFVKEMIANKRRIKINFVFVLMLVYFSIMLLGSAFSRDITLAMPSLINYVAEGLALYFLLINTIRTPSVLRSVVWSLLVAGAIIGGLTLYQQVTGTFQNNYWGYAQVTGRGFSTDPENEDTSRQPRVSGPIGEKNRFAQVMLLMVPVGLFHAWGEQSKRLRFLAIVMTGLIFIGGSLAYSRGAQVGLLLLIAIMALMRYIKLPQLIILALGIVLIVTAFPHNAVRFLSLGAIFSSEEEGGIRTADGAIQGRYTEMLAAMLVFIDHPIIGVGPGMFSHEMAEYAKIVSLRHITATREAHSLYPGVAAETGALGFITLMAILFYTLARLAKSRKYWMERKNNRMANLSTGFFLSVVSYMTTGMFLHFAYIRYFWLFIALAIITSEFRESDVTAEMETSAEIAR